MIWTIYNELTADGVISDLIGNRIKFYEYPEPNDVKETHIIIDPLDPPKPGDFADDNWLTDDYLFQIDVWSKDMVARDLIANKIRHVMWQLNFRQIGGMDEYDKEYDIYRDARRYRGKAYRKDFNRL
ncbi:hypothetical protein J14TS2_45050 [Bacillus sp. J14TS2]|uniref:hypothetical protein n=1 Tax=Bacillus sp. J14TS2 TaxID=2807188 RepID=UPI001B2AF605|nr:hypothetical protein [Bacillus sp. J14TS2]GIN74030.1 hypothetical protein J14TS2_45050 [Bacillus sp. J14TS2]